MTRWWILLCAFSALLALPFKEPPIAQTGKGQVTLHYIPGSTVKLEQLIGDYDNQTKGKTRNQSFTRYFIRGTDLGYSFEHKGKVFFLFGDTLGRWAGDIMGYSSTTNPEKGLDLDFFTDHKGRYLKVEPPNISMKGFEVPVSGISSDGKMYVVVKTNHSRQSPTDVSLLTYFDEDKKEFKVLREISRLPQGKFIKMSMRHEPEPIAGLPPDGPHILIWGSGVYRESHAYLSVVPKRELETGKGSRYFAGLDKSGNPVWSDRETEAKPVVEHSTIGDLSVTWVSALKLWLMTYDSRKPRGVLLRYARAPWGPWSDSEMIFNTTRDKGLGHFIHMVEDGKDDGLAGPVIGAGKADPKKVQGGAYAPYVIERFTKVEGDKLTIYFVLSTWNPYVVVLMRSQLEAQR